MAISWKNPSPKDVASSALPDYYGQVGLDVSVVEVSTTKCRVSIDIYFWSKYGINDSSYTLSLNGSAQSGTNAISTGSLEEDDTNWGTIYQVKLTKSPVVIEVDRGSSDTSQTFTAALSGIGWVDNKCGSAQTMTHSVTVTIPAIPIPIEIEATASLVDSTHSGWGLWLQGYCRARIGVNILSQGASAITSYKWSTGETTQEFTSSALTEAGTHTWTVTVENAHGQTATASVSVDVLPVEGDLFVPFLDNGQAWEPVTPCKEDGKSWEMYLPTIET